MEVKEKMEDIESESRSIIENKKVSEKKIKWWVKKESINGEKKDEVMEKENV
jgi:hypothetical protein